MICSVVRQQWILSCVLCWTVYAFDANANVNLCVQFIVDWIYNMHCMQSNYLIRWKVFWVFVNIIKNIAYSRFILSKAFNESINTNRNTHLNISEHPLWEESIGNRRILLTKANDVELRCFLWCAPEQMVEQTVELSVIWDAMKFKWRH